jgi:GT2 family glycosyltransferase
LERLCQNVSEIGYVLVNFFSGDTLDHHLFELANSLDFQVHLVVVDNSGSDEEFSRLQLSLPNGICLLRGNGDLGYATGNNLGLEHCFAKRSRFAFVANPDTKPNKQTVDAALTSIIGNCDVGMVAPLIVTETGQHRFTRHFLADFDKSTPKNDEYFEDKRFVDFAEGSFFLVRKEAFEEARGIPTEFFMYHEDMAFSHAIREANWLIQHLHNHQLVHYTNPSRRNSPAYAYYMTRNIWLLGRFIGYEGEDLKKFTENWNEDFVHSMKNHFRATEHEDQIFPALELGWRDGEEGFTGPKLNFKFDATEKNIKAPEIVPSEPYETLKFTNLLRDAFPEPTVHEEWDSYYLRKRIIQLETDRVKESLAKESFAEAQLAQIAPVPQIAPGFLVKLALRVEKSRRYHRLLRFTLIKKIANWVKSWTKM